MPVDWQGCAFPVMTVPDLSGYGHRGDDGAVRVGNRQVVTQQAASAVLRLLHRNRRLCPSDFSHPLPFLGGGLREGERQRTANQAAAFTSIFFCCSTAFAVFGMVMVSTPLANSAAILSRSTPSGTVKLRWNEP